MRYTNNYKINYRISKKNDYFIIHIKDNMHIRPAKVDCTKTEKVHTDFWIKMKVRDYTRKKNEIWGCGAGNTLKAEVSWDTTQCGIFGVPRCSTSRTKELVVRNSIDTISLPFGIVEYRYLIQVSILGIVTGIVTKNIKKKKYIKI